MSVARLLSFLAVIFLWSAAALAAPSWKVTEMSGDVVLTRPGMQNVALSRGASLQAGDAIQTGKGGRAVLTRDQEYVILAPESRLRLPEVQAERSLGQVLQDFGTALFKIEKKATPHFEVRTPYLAAVVKGTKFSVTVGAAEASVQVTEGAVSVEALDGLSQVLVTPGDIAMVRAGGSVEILDPSAPVAPPAEPASPTERATPSQQQAALEESVAPAEQPVVQKAQVAPAPRIERVISAPRVDIASATDGLITEISPTTGPEAFVQAAALDAAATKVAVEPRSVVNPDTGGGERSETPGSNESNGNGGGKPDVAPGTPGNGNGNGNGGGKPDVAPGTPGNGNGNSIGGGKPDAGPGTPGKKPGNGGGKPDVAPGTPGQEPGNSNGGGKPDAGPGTPGKEPDNSNGGGKPDAGPGTPGKGEGGGKPDGAPNAPDNGNGGGKPDVATIAPEFNDISTTPSAPQRPDADARIDTLPESVGNGRSGRPSMHVR